MDNKEIKKPLISLSGIVLYTPSIKHTFNKDTLKFESKIVLNSNIKPINNKIWR